MTMALCTRPTYFSHNSSGEALFGLSWTRVVLIEIYKNKTQVSQDDLKQLVSF
jgi:hypothetical protein